jgi:hypothetical protein
MTGPGCATNDVDIVVASDFLTSLDVSSRHKETLVTFVKHVSVGITTVVQMSIRRPQENHFPVRIIAMIGTLAEVLAHRCSRSDFPNHVDLSNALPCEDWGYCEDSKALYG